MERGEGRQPGPEETMPSEQHAEQIQHQAPDLPGGDVFVAHAEDIRSKIPEQSNDPAVRLAAMIRIITGEEVDNISAEESLLYEALLPYLTEYPALSWDEITLAQACDLLRTPVDVPSWVYATGSSDAVASFAARLRAEQLRDLLKRG